MRGCPAQSASCGFQGCASIPTLQTGEQLGAEGPGRMQAAGAEPAVSIEGPNLCGNSSFLQQFVSLLVLS